MLPLSFSFLALGDPVKGYLIPCYRFGTIAAYLAEESARKSAAPNRPNKAR